jgi:lauroyl/myristoyl acyltransferase
LAHVGNGSDREDGSAEGVTARADLESDDRDKLITKSDVLLVATLAVCFPIAWVMPERWWPAFAKGITAASAPFRRTRYREITETIRSIFGDRTLPVAAETLPRLQDEMMLIEWMQRLRGHRPGGWNPPTTLIGPEHIDRALENGHGAILWITDFCFTSLVTKIALHRAGYRLTHLSRPDHGFSDTRFGVRFLNPILTRLEDRYLEERVVIDEGQMTSGLRTLVRRLKSNRVISITVVTQARQTVQLPILDGYIHLAKGAPWLAITSGAPLLPVFTLLGDDGAFVTTVQSPLEFSREGPPEQIIERAMKGYVERLEPLLLEVPHLWYDWSDRITPRPFSPQGDP